MPIKPEYMIMKHYMAIISLTLFLKDLRVSHDDTVRQALTDLALKDRGIGIDKMTQLVNLVLLPKIYR